jgi:hypothetical protein
MQEFISLLSSIQMMGAIHVVEILHAQKIQSLEVSIEHISNQ